MKSLLAAVGGGLLLALAFPQFKLGLLAWIALVPLFLVLERDRSAARAPLCGAAFGVAFFLVDMSWIYYTVRTHGHFDVAPAVLTLLALIFVLAAFPAAFASAVAFFSRRGLSLFVTAPFVWTAIEYIRSVAFSGFPWDLLGYSQAERLSVVQIADLTGVYGISFLIILVNGAVSYVIQATSQGKRPSALFPSIAGLAVILTLVYGHVRTGAFPASPISRSDCRIAVLQGNIPQETKWEPEERAMTFATYERLSSQAAQNGARLIIWPETSVPVIMGGQDRDATRPREISRTLKTPMLVGAPYREIVDREIRYYNSALLMDGETIHARYDKIHLVPFGEYMPLSWLLPLGPGIAAREVDYSPGQSMTVMGPQGCPRFSVLICYEAIFPELARMAVANGAQLLVNITNDGWFGATAAPYQHLAMARLRSVENRVWLLRSANTGVSAAFDAAGRMVESIPLQREGYFIVQPPDGARPGSFYSGFGDVFAWLCLSACGFLGCLSIVNRKREYSARVSIQLRGGR
jgi:apolipoprotein N-acyltransferase